MHSFALSEIDGYILKGFLRDWLNDWLKNCCSKNIIGMLICPTSGIILPENTFLLNSENNLKPILTPKGPNI